jgi:hypothetical protein
MRRAPPSPRVQLPSPGRNRGFSLLAAVGGGQKLDLSTVFDCLNDPPRPEARYEHVGEYRDQRETHDDEKGIVRVIGHLIYLRISAKGAGIRNS